MVYDTSVADASYALAAKWDDARDASKFPQFSVNDVKDWTSPQFGMLLETLVKYKPFSKTVVDAIDKVYSVSESSNPEIKVRERAPAQLAIARIAREASLDAAVARRM